MTITGTSAKARFVGILAGRDTTPFSARDASRGVAARPLTPGESPHREHDQHDGEPEPDDRRRAAALALAPRCCVHKRLGPQQDHEDEQEAPGEENDQREAGDHVERPFGRPLGTAPAARGRSRRCDGDEREQREEPEHAHECAANALCHATVHRMMRRQQLAERWPRPAVMAVLNVTPDSFSDGGRFASAEAAVAAAIDMLDAGAALVDVGGESTRPGAAAVPADEELRRVLPVLEGLQGRATSIDTTKAEVARHALALGVEMVNDVTALRGDPDLAGVVADAGAYVCLMHMQGEPRTMQDAPRYADVVEDVASFLEATRGVRRR